MEYLKIIYVLYEHTTHLGGGHNVNGIDILFSAFIIRLRLPGKLLAMIHKFSSMCSINLTLYNRTVSAYFRETVVLIKVVLHNCIRYGHKLA